MQTKKWLTVIILVVGGITVLGSYVYGIQAYSGEADLLWGGVPQAMLPFYTANMLLAALGYFAFTYFILFRLSTTQTSVFRRFGFGIFNILYAAILIPSALWMPLTILVVEQPSTGTFWAVKLALWVVAFASLALLLALWKVEPRQPGWAHRLAVMGSVFFCIQTVILDAIVWVAFFN